MSTLSRRIKLRFLIFKVYFKIFKKQSGWQKVFLRSACHYISAYFILKHSTNNMRKHMEPIECIIQPPTTPEQYTYKSSKKHVGNFKLLFWLYIPSIDIQQTTHKYTFREHMAHTIFVVKVSQSSPVIHLHKGLTWHNLCVFA